MKTYVIKWGEDCNGGRYALTLASSIQDAWLNADSVGAPFKIAELKLPRTDDEGFFYLEIDEPKDKYCGSSFDDLRWKKSSDPSVCPY